MPAKSPEKSLQEVVDAVGVYPQDAFLFVQQGLTFTVEKIHGNVTDPEASHHVGGRELCQGLHELALQQWGFLARTVLARWNITSTLDFGRIVFALVQHRHLQKTDDDNLEDFRNVYDFRAAFETSYRIAGLMEIESPRPSGQKS